jgi:hypothetical protein
MPETALTPCGQLTKYGRIRRAIRTWISSDVPRPKHDRTRLLRGRDAASGRPLPGRNGLARLVHKPRAGQKRLAAGIGPQGGPTLIAGSENEHNDKGW